MASELIAHLAFVLMGYWLRAHSGSKNKNSLWLFFIQMWSLYQNIFLYRYTFLLLLEFLMKTL